MGDDAKRGGNEEAATRDILERQKAQDALGKERTERNAAKGRAGEKRLHEGSSGLLLEEQD